MKQVCMGTRSILKDKTFSFSEIMASDTQAPYHRTTAGQLECYLGELKKAWKWELWDLVNLVVTQLLCSQHCAVHRTTVVGPAKAMFGCEMSTHLDMLYLRWSHCWQKKTYAKTARWMLRKGNDKMVSSRGYVDAWNPNEDSGLMCMIGTVL